MQCGWSGTREFACRRQLGDSAMQLKRLHLYWRLFWKFRALRLMLLFEYRTDFYFWCVVSVLWTGFNFFFFELLLRVNNTIAGWTKPEMYVLLATYTIIDSFTWSFFNRVMRGYTQAVFEGSFDQFLLRPLDPQLSISIQDNNYSQLPRFFIGIAVLWWAAHEVVGQPTFTATIGYIVLVCCSLLIIYNIWFAVATLAFYVERLNNINDIIPGLRRVFQVPRGLYQGVSALLFTIILPFGLVSSIPAEVILGKWELAWVLYFVVFTIASTAAVRAFFQYSILRYSGAGS